MGPPQGRGPLLERRYARAVNDTAIIVVLVHHQLLTSCMCIGIVVAHQLHVCLLCMDVVTCCSL